MVEISIFKIIAIIGLLILTCGIVTKKERKRDTLFVIGGVMLVSYSIYIKDVIIIAVQSIFTIAAAYNLLIKGKLRVKNNL